MDILVTLETISILIFALITFCRKESILDFTNSSLQMKLSAEFKRIVTNESIKRFLVLLFIFIIIFFLQYFGAFQISIATFLINIVLSYPFVISFSFVSFINNFECFIIAAMKEFTNDLKLFSNSTSVHNQERNVEFFLKLLESYQKIFDLTKRFNCAFGKQLTFFVCEIAILFVFNVSFPNT